MKKKIGLLVLINLIILITITLSQTNLNPLQKEILMPIPSWVKEGTCVVYKLEGGTRVGKGAESSAVYGTGYSIYLVTSISNNKVIGIVYNIQYYPTSGDWSFFSQMQVLNKVGAGLYLHPKIIEQALKDRELFAQYGISVEGGPIGKDLYYFAITTRTQDEITTTADTFTSEGLIKKSTITRQNPQGGDAGKKELIGVYNISLPQNLKIPDIVRQKVIYSLSTVIMGISSYAGSVSYSLTNIEGKLVNFVTQSTIGYSSSSGKAIGDPLIGPFYINPALLKRNPIITIPQIGFSLSTAGYGPNGGILVVLSISGQPLSQSEYDPNTGLLLSSAHMSSGTMFYAQLQR